MMIDFVPPLYKVRYVEIAAHKIFNECGPEAAGPPGEDDRNTKKRKKAAQKYIDRLNNKNGFYEKLEKSIIDEGIRNPILVNAGYIPSRKLFKLPVEMKNDHNKILVCHHLGGSRLWVAQKLDMIVPCLVSDYCDMFSMYPALSDDEIMLLFKDKPRAVVRGRLGLVASNLPQIHLGINLND